jgi:hypothetical protein
MEQPFAKGDRVVIIKDCKEQFAPNFDGHDTGIKFHEGMIGTITDNWYMECKYTEITLDKCSYPLWVLTENLGLILPFVKTMKVDVIYYPEGE